MHTMRYDTTEEFNVDSKAECDQLNLAHVAGKNSKEETKTNKRQCPLISVQVQDPWTQSRRNQETMEDRIRERDVWQLHFYDRLAII